MASIMDYVTLHNALLAIYVPSGLSKIFDPSQVKEMWPRLPNWFWPGAGIWEVAGATLTYTGYAEIGLPLLYAFMGGVLCSILYIPDHNGHTHVGGKGKIGSSGPAILVPASLGTALLLKVDHAGGVSDNWPILPIVCGIAGWIWGAVLVQEKKTKKKA